MEDIIPIELVHEEPSSPQNYEEFELLVKNKLKHITSSTTSPNRKYILITTDKGFVLVNPELSQFTRLHLSLR